MLLFVVASCGDRGAGAPPALQEVPLHLEDQLRAAVVEAGSPPENPPAAVEWSFERAQPDWRVVTRPDSDRQPLELRQLDDGLRLVLTPASRTQQGQGRDVLQGSIYVELPGWRREDWAYVAVRARASPAVSDLALMFNLRDQPSDTATGPADAPFALGGQYVYLINDESVQTYLLRVDWAPDWHGAWQDAEWRELGLQFTGPAPSDDSVSAPGGEEAEPAWIDILSVSVAPKGYEYAGASTGVRTEVRGREYRRALWARTPTRLRDTLTVPDSARLDFGMGVLQEEPVVTFRIVAETPGGTDVLFDEPWRDPGRWGQRSVDLGALAGQTVTLSLEADAASAGPASGNLAFWTAPTIGSAVASDKPNIIFYVIDGGTAEQMSIYGYNRRTTPHLERIAAEGALFEYAYSNSSWTKTSTPSFMTSLHHSVLGGWASDNDPLPDGAVTMAQHLHAAGYQTAVLTTNPYAGVMSSLDRSVDVLREAGVEPNVTSSTALHEDFWRWRETYPGTPYWVHFQTTDVHWPRRPLPPFAGLFVTPERRALHERQELSIGTPFPGGASAERFAALGIDRTEFRDTLRGLYDETMAHQDSELGRLAERLRRAGEWENTLLIIAADHGTGNVFSVPEGSDGSIFSYAYRIPLIFVWPARIAPGQRFAEPVSMIDVLPTVLDLAGLPPAEVAQGQSLAPLLLGREGWQRRPVVIDEFYVDGDTGELSGYLAMVDDRWLAWLDVLASGGDGAAEALPRLELYDRLRLPLGGAVNDAYPELVADYRRRLEETWNEHRVLARRFSRSGAAQLSTEQLQTLRALGYIR